MTSKEKNELLKSIASGIDSNSDEELNKILTIIAYLSDKYNFDYKVEDEIQ